MDAPPTHWKQTLFYLKDNIVLKKDEEINGKFSLRQNKANKRHLDFAIELDILGYYMQYQEKQLFFMR